MKAGRRRGMIADDMEGVNAERCGVVVMSRYRVDWKNKKPRKKYLYTLLQTDEEKVHARRR
jgi:hypothetical protein